MAEMADSAVEAIGQCAIRVSSVADSCLSGLVSLIASSNENVVSAAVIVLKRLFSLNALLVTSQSNLSLYSRKEAITENLPFI